MDKTFKEMCYKEETLDYQFNKQKELKYNQFRLKRNSHKCQLSVMCNVSFREDCPTF